MCPAAHEGGFDKNSTEVEVMEPDSDIETSPYTVDDELPMGAQS